MEKDRSARLIAIVALVLAVTGVSIGFAVLSTNLTIQEPEAKVKANDKLFTVYFSALPNQYQSASVTPELSEHSDEPTFTGNKIEVQQNSTTLSGIGGTFTKPGQTITYAIGVSNQSKLDGYLTSIVFSDVNGEVGKKVKCEPTVGTNQLDQSEIESVCDNIKVSVKVNGSEYNSANVDNINGIKISKETTMAFTVIIKYEETATPATGDFTAKFGSIVLGFKTKDNSEAV